ncbi:uncharacterized protein [Asterias amurensis]|uniref:uncharacterized protein n=1 Tax=Asterias amurensis TaxID=7602 RepID=UPI003AB74FD9
MKKPRELLLLLTVALKVLFLLLVLTERSLTSAPLSDTILPQISGCPDDITKVVPTGSRSYVPVEWTDPTAKDNSGSYACVKNVRRLYPYRKKHFPPNTTTPIKYIFSDCPQHCQGRERDCIGNEAFCSFNVIVKEEFECVTDEIVLEDPSFSPTPQNITSPFYPMEYPSDSSCHWLAMTSGDSHSSANTILVSITEIQLQLNDALLIGGADRQEAVTYRGRLPQRVLLFQGAEIEIEFRSGSRGVTVLRGFSLEVSAVVSNDNPSWCNDDHGYQCLSSPFCIDEWYLCDGISDCPHSDDESNCSHCNDIVQSLPFNMTFDTNDVINSIMSDPKNLSTSSMEWCFDSSSGYNIMIDFPSPGNDYLVIQDPTTESNQDTVVIQRHSMVRSFSFNVSSLWVRWYPGIDGQRASFSLSVNSKLDDGYCDAGYQCRNSHVCVGRENDCDGVLDCPLGEEEMTCHRRRCPKSCDCRASLGSLKVLGCRHPWTPELSKSAPVITTHLAITEQSVSNITSGFFKGLSNLINLEIMFCPVDNIWIDAFQGLDKLQSMCLIIDLRRTYNYTFAGLPNLMKLEISTKLEEMEPGSFHGMSKLTSLSLYNNKMTTLPSGLFNSLSELTMLNLGKNSLSHLPADVFVGLKNLQKLKLFSNRLHSIPRGIFRELLSLEQIDIASNGISELPEEIFFGLYNLKKIVLQYNNLSYFRDGFLTNFTRLEGIYSKNNSIKVIQPNLFHGLINLACIDLRNNLLKEIPEDSLQDNKLLAQLYLAGNNISSLDPKLLDGLSVLDKLALEDNRIKSLHPGQFRDLSSLNSLYLSNNELSGLKNGTFLGLQSLSDLSLNDNEIAEIEPGTFQGLENLVTLDLSNNTITVLEEGAFQGLSSLDYLYLSGNPLQKIHPSVFDIFKHLKVLKTDDHAVCCFIDSSTTVCDVISEELRPPYLTCEDHRLLSQDVMKAFIWVQVVLAITGNFLVLVWRGSKLQGSKNKTQMLLISNLAASDLLMGLYLLIIAAADLHYGNNFLLQTASWRSSIMCKIAGVIGLVSSEASVFLVTLISFDRFMGVVFFMSRFRLTTRVTVRVLAVLWLVAVGVSATASALSATNGNFYELSNVCLGLPLSTKPANYTITVTNEESAEGGVLITRVDTSGNKPAWIFPIVVFLGVNLLSFILILIFYVFIFIFSKTSAKKSQRPEDKEKELKLACRMLFIVGTDFACWVPVIIMGILAQSGLVEIHQTMYAWTVILILPINSAINPWLYTLSYTSPSTWRKLCKRIRGRRDSTQTMSTDLQMKK